MRLFIAEKASLAHSIADALASQLQVRVTPDANCYKVGNDNVVAYCSGHILREFEPHEYNPAWQRWNLNVLPMVPAAFQMNPDPAKAGLINTIRTYAAKATDIVHAGDPDREGQAIVNNVLAHIGNTKPVLRIWLKELNIPGVVKALGSMKSNATYDPLYDAARARTEADWGIGLNTTRASSIVYGRRTGLKGKDGTIHAGRVTTPTLGLVVARDLEIENFVAKSYYTVKATVQHANGTFTATWQPAANAAYLDSEGRVLDQTVAAAVAAAVNGKPAKVTSLKVEPKKVPAPLPFTLAELQKAANAFGLSPAETLAAAQSLYETHKLTSYPRTDCAYLPEAEHKDAGAKLAAAKANFGSAWPFTGTPDLKLKGRAYNDKQLGAHTGLVPTTQRGSIAALKPHELIVYRLVVRNFLAQFFDAYAYESTVVNLSAAKEMFRAAGTVEKDAGWKVLFRVAGMQDNEEEKGSALPLLAKGDAAAVVKAEVKAEKTKAPARFNGATLIDAMQNAHRYVTDPAVKKLLKATEGIGTEATRATIIEQLLTRGYLTEVKAGKKSYYESTEKGRLTIRILPAELTKPDLTAWFEGQLDEIAKGKLAIADFRASFHKFEAKLLTDAKNGTMATRIPTTTKASPAPTAPVAGGKVMVLRPAATKFSAKSTVGSGAGATGKTCPDCGSPLVERKRKSDGRSFLGCSNFPNCRHIAAA